jgi:hypothetical protein
MADTLSRLEDKTADYLATNIGLREVIGLPANAVIEPDPLGEGEHNVNFSFANPADGKKYILRVNVLPQPFHENQIRYEYDALKLVEPSARTPKALYVDDSLAAPAHGASVISFCEGEQFDYAAQKPKDLARIAQIMADIHAVPVSQDAPLYRPADALKSMYKECLERFEAYRVSAFETPRLTRWVERFIDAVQPALATRPIPACSNHVINTEPLAAHFLLPQERAQAARSKSCTLIEASCAQFDPCQPVTNQSAGVRPSQTHSIDNPGFFVDWERPLIGEVAQDIAYFTSPTTSFWDSDFLFPESDVEGFVNLYWKAVDGRFERGNFDERLRAYRQMTALRSTTWCCKAQIRYASRDAAHTTDKTAAKLPIYLSDEFMDRLMHEVFGK